MKYLLLLFHAESPELGSPEAMAAWGVYEEELIRRGAKVSAAALHPVATATTVRQNGDERITIDGPYAETKEQLGGYFVLECRDLDEALDLAAITPWSQTGWVEVRPIMNYG